MNTLLSNAERTLIFERLISVFAEPQAAVLTETISMVAGHVGEKLATRTDVEEIKGIIRALAEAQARTEEAVRALATAQRRTEERLEELAEAQARTAEEFRQYREASEARFLRIEAALDRLAEAQARTDESIKALAEAQARTEEEFRRYREASEARFLRIEAALDRLAEAQARTEEEFHRFRAMAEERFARLETAQARTERKVDQLAKQVGGLSETVGGDIEDIAYIVLHRVLGQKKGWKVGELKRTWHRWNGRQVEVNIFGEAHDPTRPDRRIWIVGEAKHNLTAREVEKFARVVRLARQNLEGEIYPVCFCYRARPEVQERIRELGFPIIFSYGELVEPAPRGEE
jgi:hypothetical protein